MNHKQPSSKLFIYHEIQTALASENLFDQVMTLQGEIFRKKESRETLRVYINTKPYFLKKHFGVGWLEIFKEFFQGRLAVLSARTEFRAIQFLHAYNINTLDCVGFGQYGFNPAKLKSFILTREITNALSLEEICHHWQLKRPTWSFKIRLLNEVARIAKIMHQHGACHRDFYLCHLLLQNPDEYLSTEKPCRLHVIDLHRMRLSGSLRQRWRVKDLAALYFSTRDVGLTKGDYLRFIKLYSDCSLREALQKNGALWLNVKLKGQQLGKRIRG